MRAKLTDRTLQSLVAPTGKYVEVWDEAFHTFGASFGVRVSGATGSKTWVLLYNRSKRLVLGRYPVLSLANARKEAYRVAAEILANDRDPLAERKAVREAPTFAEVAERFVREYPKLASLRPRTEAEYRRVVERELIPRWGEKKADAISRKDVIAVLDDMRINRNAPIASNRTRALISCLFRWALERDLVAASPAVALPRRPQERSRDRVLSDQEVAVLWRELGQEAEPVRSFYKLLLICGQRSGETRIAKWVDIDIEDGVWSIPAANTKASRSHRVPLCSLAQAVLADLKAVTGKAEYVFQTPSPRGEGAVRWVHRATERIRNRCGFDWRAHDLRRTCATG
jgi:integrase